MSKSILFLLCSMLLFLSIDVCAQQSETRMKMDLGKIERGSDRIFETSIVNPGIKPLTLLRVKGAKAYDVRTDTMRIGIGERLRIRIKFNPQQTGKYKDDIQFFFNEITYLIQVSADVEYVDNSDQTPCPDFARSAEAKPEEWEVYFKVIDRDTREALPKATIRLEGRGGNFLELQVDKRGELLAQVPIDFYLIYAEQDGYANFRQENYINKRNKDFVLELMAGESGSVVVWRPSQQEKETEDAEELQDQVVLIPDGQDEVTRLVDEGNKDFTIDKYRANNVVFLIDISTSMRKEERIDILKVSMIELAEMLRADDIISIVTYASKTEIVLSGKSAEDKEQIRAVIESLEAEGLTAGEAGLKQAYKICKKYFITDGNNQIYLATDGAFNKDLDKIKDMVASKSEVGLKLSILSIKGNKWAASKMEELAVLGLGSLVAIDDSSYQDSLNSLIKDQSRR